MSKMSKGSVGTKDEGLVFTELYGGKVIVRFKESTHRYGVSIDGGKKFAQKTGVTTFLNIKDKSRPLMIWQQQVAFGHLMDLIKKGVKIDIDKAAEACVQHEIQKDEAADIGKEIHSWAEHYIRYKLKEKGFEKIPGMPEFPEAVTGVNAFLDWEKAHKVKFVETENFVYSKKYDYVGMEDVQFVADGIFCDADFKSSNGLYNSVRMQTAAYAKARMEAGGKKSEGRWAIRFSKYTEEEYMKREKRKNEIKAIFAKSLGREVKTYPIKPYQVFEAVFLDKEKGNMERDFKAFLNCMELTKWDRATDVFYNGGLE